METECPDGLNFFDMLFFDAMEIEKKGVYMEIGEDGVMEFRSGKYPHEGIRIGINWHDNLANNIYCRIDKDEDGTAGMSCRIKDDGCCDNLSGLWECIQVSVRQIQVYDTGEGYWERGIVVGGAKQCHMQWSCTLHVVGEEDGDRVSRWIEFL